MSKEETYLKYIENLKKNDLMVIKFKFSDKIIGKIQICKDWLKLKESDSYNLETVLNIIENYEPEIYFIPQHNTPDIE
jgi:hypothetical protein